MAKGKYQSAGRLAGRSLAVILAMILICGGVVGGTVAWLIANPAPVVNTFTYGDINIRLEETNTNLDGDNDPNTNEYEMIPGREIVKDPKVTVLGGSEDCWLFVKLDKSETFDTYLTYSIDDTTVEGATTIWTALGDAYPGVYYREVNETTTNAVSFTVLKGDAVQVKDGVTKEQMDALAVEDAVQPKLTITAYACQKANIDTAVAAWNEVAK